MSYAFLPGQGPGLTGLQPPPLDPRQQLQQLQQQQFASQMQQQLLGREGKSDLQMIRDNRPGNSMLPRPPKAEGLGVSNFVGASSNDMQRMLNRGSISGDNMGDAQRRMEQLRSNEFLAKMRAQNPERFNNPPPSAPPTDPRIFPTPPPPPLAGGAPQYPGNVPPGVDPGTLPRPPNIYRTMGEENMPPPSSLPGLGGIMGQAPPSMQRNIPLMQNQMQNQQPPNYGPQQMSAFGQGASNYSGSIGNPRMSPFQQMSPSGFAMMQPSTGSQNSAPIPSPFA